MKGLEGLDDNSSQGSPSKRDKIFEPEENSIFAFVKEICNEKKKIINSYFRQNPQFMHKLMYHTLLDYP
jgi:hypothetical protein